MWNACFVAVADDVIEKGYGFVVFMLENAVVGSCQTAKLYSGGVGLQVGFDSDEMAELEPQLERAAEMVRCFATQGADRTMNMYNNGGK